jgi:sulfur carrier protein
VTVNGTSRDVAEGTTLEALLGLLEVGAAGLAAAVNDRVVPRDGRAQLVLAEGDRVEIVRAVAGG